LKHRSRRRHGSAAGSGQLESQEGLKQRKVARAAFGDVYD